MKDVIKEVYTRVSKNKLQSHNYSITTEKALCLNILEIPETNISLLTASVMNGKKKSAILDYKEFAKMMTAIEKALNEVSEKLKFKEYPFFVPISKELNNNWYRRLNCHRLFLIPTEYTFSVVEYLTKDSFISYVREVCGVEEVIMYVNIKDNKLRITRTKKF